MITSTKNPNVLEIKKLLSKSKYRKNTGTFVAEGIRLVFDIINSGHTPIKLFATEEIFKKYKASLPECEIILVSDSVMESLSDTKTPQGLLAVFKIPQYQRDILRKRDPLFLLILQDLRDPGNLGTIFRTFEAAGGDAVILFGNCVDPFSPKCIRSTMGSAVRLPLFLCEDMDSLDNLIEDLTISVYAAHMEGKAYWQGDYTSSCAFVIGNEANGVSTQMFDYSNDTISIPMDGKVESLNAAVSASLVSYEVKRQRTIKG